jgi:hypothetical protein
MVSFESDAGKERVFVILDRTTGASGAYKTAPGATVHEWGDRVPNRSRVVPLSATLAFDFSGLEPSLLATITNAVLEGGDPFSLVVRSSSASPMVDGTYRFEGDYLREIYPSGSGYYFDWRFSTSTNGEVVWNGGMAWTGGHAWYVTVSNITLVPVAWLNISRVGPGSVQIAWSTNFVDRILECATNLPARDWSTVTNSPTSINQRFVVTVAISGPQRFFRLRGP